MLGFAPTLVWLFVARIWSGIATANIAVAQAYIADVTTPEKRARGMAIVGIAFGLGFIFGPFIGGELSRFHVARARGDAAGAGGGGPLDDQPAAGAAHAARVAAARARAASRVRRASPIDLGAFRAAVAVPGVGAAVAINFMLILWFSGMEQTFRLFTADGFGMSDAGTGRVFGLVGIVSALRARRPRRAAGPAVRRGAPRQGGPRRPGAGVRAARAVAAVRAVGQGGAAGRLGAHRARQRPLLADAAGVRLAPRQRRRPRG